MLDRASEALIRVNLGSHASRAAVFQKDQLELVVLKDLSTYDVTTIDRLAPRMDRVLTTDAAKAQPRGRSRPETARLSDPDRSRP